jgi:hypothetical protein
MMKELTIMRLFLNILFCVVASLSLNAAFADGAPGGLTVSCSVLDSQYPTAANVPIWLDVKVTNSGTVTFNGDSTFVAAS